MACAKSIGHQSRNVRIRRPRAGRVRRRAEFHPYEVENIFDIRQTAYEIRIEQITAHAFDSVRCKIARKMLVRETAYCDNVRTLASSIERTACHAGKCRAHFTARARDQ